MIKKWGETISRKIPHYSSVADFFQRMPANLTDAIAFVGLAAFFLFPLILSLRILYHLSYDQKVFDSMFLLDWILCPLALFCAALIYILTLGKARHDKRSILAEVRKNPVVIIFALLVVWMSIDFFIFRPVQGGFLNGVSLRHESFLLNLEYYIVFFALGAFLRNPRMKLWLLRLLVFVSVFMAPCALYFWRHISASPVYDWYPMLDSVFSNTNYYGYFLSVAIGLCAGLLAWAERPAWRAFYAAALVVNTVVLTFNLTLGAWVASFCACVFLIVACRLRDNAWNRWAFAALGLYVATLAITGLFNGQLLPELTGLSSDVNTVLTNPDSQEALDAGTYRWGVWARCMEILGHNPIFGIGMEGIHVHNLIQYTGNQRPHNEYIQYALFYGIPAGLLYIMGIFGIYLRGLFHRANLDNATLAALTAAMGYLVSAFFGVTVYNTTPFLFIMLGLGYVYAPPQKKTFSVNAWGRRKRR